MLGDKLEGDRMNFFSYSSLLSFKTMRELLNHNEFVVMGMGYILGHTRKDYDTLEKIPAGVKAEKDRVFGVVWGNLEQSDIDKIVSYERKSNNKPLVKVKVLIDSGSEAIEAWMFL